MKNIIKFTNKLFLIFAAITVIIFSCKMIFFDQTLTPNEIYIGLSILILVCTDIIVEKITSLKK